MKIRKNDLVEVIAGKDKGARGKVIAVYRKQDRVLVEGVNRVRKHTRVQTSRRGSKSGGIVTQEASIHVSNVMVVDDEGNPTRIGYQIDEETGVKLRVAKTTGRELP